LGSMLGITIKRAGQSPRIVRVAVHASGGERAAQRSAEKEGVIHSGAQQGRGPASP